MPVISYDKSTNSAKHLVYNRRSHCISNNGFSKTNTSMQVYLVSWNPKQTIFSDHCKLGKLSCKKSRLVHSSSFIAFWYFFGQRFRRRYRLQNFYWGIYFNLPERVPLLLYLLLYKLTGFEYKQHKLFHGLVYRLGLIITKFLLTI